MEFEVCIGDYTRLGVGVQGEVTTFSIENREQKQCILVLYPREGGKSIRIPMETDNIQTFVSSIGLKHFPRENYYYTFEIDKHTVLDPYATKIVGRECWGDLKREAKNIKCGFDKKDFNWKNDTLPRVAKTDMVMYRLHVRGFSMLQKGPENQRGTIKALESRLSYLQELGITTVELMPLYEFEEVFCKDSFQRETFPKDKINYWGYTRGNYFAPKASYLGENQDSDALKQFIYRMHQKGMECILEFFFDEKLNPHYIIDVLRYWAKEYHVDGFHVICSSAVAELISQDWYLAGRKLFFQWFSPEICSGVNEKMELFSYNDEFLYTIRKLMNHQGGRVGEFANVMRRQQTQQGFVNYLATNNGFTLYDAFSYTEKRNQANGEENRDGNNDNYSCNCGQEGITKNKQVLALRERQMKNALCALMLAQGIPLIWMGDENGNSQAGNNNAYCQDNEIGWRHWSTAKASKELVSFLKELSRIRREYPVLRNAEPMRLNDYKGTGYPDLSYHGDNGWRMEPGGNDKTIGMMYSNKYASETEKINDDYIYIGYNFSVADQKLALPALPKKYVWHVLLDTSAADAFEMRPMEVGARDFNIPSQCVCMLIGKREDAK